MPTTFIALSFADLSVGRMQLFVDPTTENIQATIDGTQFEEGAPTSWRIVDAADFPDSSPNRQEWRDDGETITEYVP